jgi:tryptophan synthase alpha subunit
MMKSISSTLSVCPLSLMGYAEETQEQQVEKLIKQLQDQDSDVRLQQWH